MILSWWCNDGLWHGKGEFPRALVMNFSSDRQIQISKGGRDGGRVHCTAELSGNEYFYGSYCPISCCVWHININICVYMCVCVFGQSKEQWTHTLPLIMIECHKRFLKEFSSHYNSSPLTLTGKILRRVCSIGNPTQSHQLRVYIGFIIMLTLQTHSHTA